MAMFGMTAGALVVYFRGERFSSRTLSHDLATAIIVWLQLILLLATPFSWRPRASRIRRAVTSRRQRIRRD